MPKSSSESPKHRPYWQAKGTAEIATARFERARAKRDEATMRSTYFMLTRYYARTLLLLRVSLEDREESLAVTTLNNLLVLDSVLGAMHRAEPDVIPLALPLTKTFYESYVRGLILRVFDDASSTLALPELQARLVGFGLLGDIDLEEIEGHCRALSDDGVLARQKLGFRRTVKPYIDLAMDGAILQTLVGAELAAQLERRGFEGLSDMRSQRADFISTFTALTGMSVSVAALLIDVAIIFQDEQRATRTAWRYRDLVHSRIPRPYQLEAYAVFRGHGYRASVVEAPTGSGKTLIGMMCIQDWLEAMVPGQSVLVLVPTASYQQQWMRELCYHHAGLQLAPEVVFAGTPSELSRLKKRTGEVPAVIVLTYTALGQMCTVQGAFSEEPVMALLMDYGIENVILDEVHKVAADLRSASAKVIGALGDVLRSGKLPHLIGFTGTASSYAAKFEQLGLRLVHSVPIVEIVASGFVAPFAEFGVPFAYSERERTVRALLDRYKDIVRRFLELIDISRLRRESATIPVSDRVRIAHSLLGMYYGRKDAEAAIRERLQDWEQDGEFGLSDTPLVSIMQIATGKTDAEMIAEGEGPRLDKLIDATEQIRGALQSLLLTPEAQALLGSSRFARTLDVAALRSLMNQTGNARRRSQARMLLASTFVGLYAGVSGWYRNMGEGRVSAIRSIIRAEEQTRKVSGVIVFDQGTPIRWERGLATPGYAGVAGLFSETLGDPDFVPVAAISSELYLPWQETDPLPSRIADYIESNLMLGTIGEAMQALMCVGLEWHPNVEARFKEMYATLIRDYIQTLAAGERPRVESFSSTVLRPLRKTFGHKQRGISRQTATRLRARMHRRNPNLRSLLVTFFSYAGLVRRWRAPQIAELAQANGARHRFFVIHMPGERSKQLMYDLVARLVDEDSLPINMIIVSNWARTGWNVIKPNVLIDATATRDTTAWQQLRGRSMRALGTWTNSCYRLEALLLGTRAMGLDETDQHLPEDVHRLFAELLAAVDEPLNQDIELRRLLTDLLNADEKKRYEAGKLADFTPQERRALAIRLLLRHNKVTHIYEMVKATGSPAQIILDRDTARWVRRDNIAQKHEFEVAPVLKAGQLSRGEEHAPLLYADDPRNDAPQVLEVAIRDAIDDQDTKIIDAWLEAVVSAEAQ